MTLSEEFGKLIELFQFSEFEKNFERHTKRNKPLKKKVDAIIKEFYNDPTPSYSEKLKYELTGQRCIHIEDFRLIYIYCKECRREGIDKKIKCEDCAQITDQTIKLLDFEPRKFVYRKKR